MRAAGLQVPIASIRCLDHGGSESFTAELWWLEDPFDHKAEQGCGGVIFCHRLREKVEWQTLTAVQHHRPINMSS
jgi:hypothetical protein